MYMHKYGPVSHLIQVTLGRMKVCDPTCVHATIAVSVLNSPCDFPTHNLPKEAHLLCQRYYVTCMAFRTTSNDHFKEIVKLRKCVQLLREVNLHRVWMKP